MLIINGMTHIANVILYFQLPDWFTSWADIVDEATKANGNNSDVNADSEETTILRDFLLGTDDYRDERLFIVPQLVDAPLPVKAIAPSKAEILVRSKKVLSCWHKSPSGTADKDEVDVDQKKVPLYPALELELDLIASRAIRNVVGVVSRHLHRISLDVACVIYDKDKQTSVCLTCFCFDHIDMTSCPSFPLADDYMDYAPSCQ